MIIRAMLGPQREGPNIAALVEQLGYGDSPICTVTAGWQEREGELQELEQHLSKRAVELALYQRAEQVFDLDSEFRDAYRQRQETLMTMQRLYRRRLRHALAALSELSQEKDESRILDNELRAAMRAIKTLDAQHLRRIRAIHDQFDRNVQATTRPVIAAHRSRLKELLDASGALLIAGGHVQVLLNRLRLFGLLELAGDKPIIAWSAGAMCLADRVVLFHDFPPQGPGDAEVAETGLGLFPGIVPLPHATHRLALDDKARVSAFARRFSPARSITLDPGAMLVWQDDKLIASDKTFRLTRSGTLARMRAR
jgi:peptidase E